MIKTGLPVFIQGRAQRRKHTDMRLFPCISLIAEEMNLTLKCAIQSYIWNELKRLIPAAQPPQAHKQNGQYAQSNSKEQQIHVRRGFA